VAYDGPGALTAAAAFRPDVALLDIELPGMDGCDVARRLRDLPEFEKVVLVAMTGHADDANRQRCGDSGFVFYLVKPADPWELKVLLGVLAAEQRKPEVG
jgi:two-component system, chemotaxis family, CheB/CheR fusion protein